MHTGQDISKILAPLIIEEHLTRNKVVSDFEIDLINVKDDFTALFNISEGTWLKWFDFKKTKTSQFHALSTYKRELCLVITDEVLPDNYKGDFIRVENTFEAMYKLSAYFREEYTNPLIAITGSYGKSSTRMMLEAALEDFTVLHNIGNANMRVPTLLNLCKLIKKPDFALFEVSLNALNNKGNMAKLIKPDIAIVTGIGEAHLSTIKSTKEIAEFKSRIFEGMSNEGVVIINANAPHYLLIKEKAKKFTQNISLYSIKDKDNHSTLKVMSIEYLKGKTRVSISINGDSFTYTLNCLSQGMVSNSVGAIYAAYHLNLNIAQVLQKLCHFNPLSRVLEMKEISYNDSIYTLIDDTHNASLPAMINAIKTFNQQAQFFEGRKIIALGKINDLGDNSKTIHMQLVPFLEESSADFILCMDEELKPVVNRVKGKSITWYNDEELLAHDLCSLLSSGSLTLLKSSVTGTSFPKVAQKLPVMINEGKASHREVFHTKNPRRSLTLISDKPKKNELQFSNFESIEGIAPLFYYIYAMSANISNRPLKFLKWPTNNSTYYEGKVIMLYDLIKYMIVKPHPSLVYQLAHELFDNEKMRIEQIQKFIRKYNLSPSSIINVTGRFMFKERHQFTHKDLYNIYINFEEILFKENNTIYFGYDAIHGITRFDNGILIFTSYETEMDLIHDVLNIKFKDSVN